MERRVNVNVKGTIGLAIVNADLIKRGFLTFHPYCDHSPIDLIASDQKGSLVRIQVKYRRIKKGVIEVPLYSIVNGKMQATDLSRLDAYAVYSPDIDSVAYLPTALINPGAQSFRLRVDETRTLASCKIFSKYSNPEFLFGSSVPSTGIKAA
jgi:hypothetical protein